MITIEFEADSDNGKITIPQQFKIFRNRRVKVILTAAQDPDQKFRHAGSAKGKFHMARDFAKPLSNAQVGNIWG